MTISTQAHVIPFNFVAEIVYCTVIAETIMAGHLQI